MYGWYIDTAFGSSLSHLSHTAMPHYFSQDVTNYSNSMANNISMLYEGVTAQSYIFRHSSNYPIERLYTWSSCFIRAWGSCFIRTATPL